MTPTEVCNQSLGLIGQSLISDIQDETDPTAAKCRLYYDTERRAALRDNDWNFATTTKQLALNAASTGFVRLAEDLRVLTVNDDELADWHSEGRLIITSETSCLARYVKDVTDPTLWDDLFLSAFTLRLSAKLAAAIAHDSKLAIEQFRLYQLMIEDAKSVDGQEQGGRSYAAKDLIRVRV